MGGGAENAGPHRCSFGATPWRSYRLNAEGVGGVILSGFALYSPAVVVDTLLRRQKKGNDTRRASMAINRQRFFISLVFFLVQF